MLFGEAPSRAVFTAVSAAMVGLLQSDASAATVIAGQLIERRHRRRRGSHTAAKRSTPPTSTSHRSRPAGECEAGSGTDQITFDIAGAADFINGGQNGYRISLTSPLPSLSGPVDINGFSQPGALANTV
ncbi:MAG: hypothetical protein R2714_07100 [Microthrixaceae bacterium]